MSHSSGSVQQDAVNSVLSAAAAPRILCVHQGGELYGSDRSFLQAVEALRANWPAAHIRILLAADGPLRERLAVFANEVVVRDLFVLRLATPLKTGFKATIGLPWYLAVARRDIAWADLVYINTVVIADFMLAARVAPNKVVIHAREIPKSVAMPIVRGLIRAAGAHMIYNSRATQQALAPPDRPGTVIYNGVAKIPGATPPVAPPGGFTPDRPLRIAMLGRINNWKGQDLLVAAAALLSEKSRASVRIRIVGSVYGDNTAPLDMLTEQIARAGLDAIVSVEPFTDEPGKIYEWADLCAAPSRLPEPFGRVAIEAMAHARGVLAAAHGGLIEIVEDQLSGRLLSPGVDSAITEAISDLLAAPEKVNRMGAGALDRFTAKFDENFMALQLQVCVGNVLTRTLRNGSHRSE